MGVYAYGGYDTKAGLIAGGGLGFGGGGGALGFNTNLTSAGVSRSKNGGWSANFLGMHRENQGLLLIRALGGVVNLKVLSLNKNQVHYPK
ncbi:MAG: hypothetical protein BGP01_05950 [Paludibacter sp. 47-17]|jgi:hypothetical protein|nr:MAG: hypothetical protein ABS72_00615 [Paludibacter sp. SCN 50-10]OJX88870.1 MAG: hypothetical protein BGP01_05950 [Paludibacter sp. 47-17]